MANPFRLALLATTVLGAALPEISAAQATSNDIVVTARRKEEKLQDVPISISVINQQEIANRNIVSAKDLAIGTPSLGVNSRYGGESTTFTLRGFSQETFNAPSVAVYFADVVAPRGASSIATGEGAGPGTLFDLENVQVLKGPQGTLFGRNTTGGAILLVPRKPTREFGGYIEGSYGNYDMKRIQAVLNVPLGESVRMRIGVDRMTRDGYLHNISGVGPKDLADVDYLAIRASIVEDLAPNLENYTIVSYAKSDTNNSVAQLSGCDKNKIIAGLPIGYLACQQISRQNASGDPYAVSNSAVSPLSKLRQWQIINTTTFTASDNLTIKNIVSYAQLTNYLRFDVFGGGFVLPTAAQVAADKLAGLAPAGANAPPAEFAGMIMGSTQPYNYPLVPANDQSTFTEELQFQGKGLDGKLVWQVGAYLEISNPLTNYTGFSSPSFLFCTDVVTLNCKSPYGVIGSLGRELASRYYRDLGIYAQGSYDLTDKLRVTAGLRYTDDKSRSLDNSKAFGFNSTGVLTKATCSNAGLVYPDCISEVRETSKAPTWLIDLDYRPSGDMLLYAKYARGYRQGLTNPRALVPYKTFGPEKVDSYEVGAKTSWHGAMPGHFNLAAFYNSLADAQVQVSWRNSVGVASTAVVNGGKARIYGAEADGSITPFTGFSLSASAAYLNARFTSVNVPSAPPPYLDSDVQTSTLTTLPLIFAPKFKWTATAAWTLPLADSVGKVNVSATYMHTAGYYTLANIGGDVAAYGLLNLNLNWKSVAGLPVDLSVFAANVTNRKYSTFRSAYLPNLGFNSDVLGEPRMYGIRLRYNFGAGGS